MHPALQRLVEANAALEAAELALAEAQEHRRQCGLGLTEIEDPDDRLQAALYAYGAFGKGLSLVLAEAVTGLPGKRGQSQFLVLAGRLQHQPKGHDADRVTVVSDPMTEWPAPSALERDVIESHIRHGKPYHLEHGLGWTNLSTSLTPSEATAFLRDPTAALAAHFDLSREAFVEWLSGWGHVGCEATYNNGKPCAARVAGLPGMLQVEKWKVAKAKGGYCARHGG